MRVLVLAVLFVITTIAAFSLNTISTELSLSIILSTGIFHASLCSAYALPQSLSASHARLEVKRHGDHSGNDTTQDRNDDNDRGRNRTQNNKDRNGQGNNNGGTSRNGNNANGAARSNDTADAGNRAGNENSGSSNEAGSGNKNNGTAPGTLPEGFPPSPSTRGSEGAKNAISPGSGTDTGRGSETGTGTGGSQANANSTSPGTLPLGFPPSLSTDNSEGVVNGTSSGIGTGSGTGTGNDTSTGNNTGNETSTGTLPSGFPPPVPTTAGFVAGGELGNHPRSRFEQAAKVRAEFVEGRRVSRVKARRLKMPQGRPSRSSYDV